MRLKYWILLSVILIVYIQITPSLIVVQSKINSSLIGDGLVFNSGKFEIIQTGGFGDSNNIATRGIIVFNNTLVIGTTNLNRSCMPWTINEFLKILIGGICSGSLRSNGCQIWSYDGTTMRNLIGFNKTASMGPGFNNKNNWDCSVLIEFKDKIYVGLWNPIEGGQIWRTSDIYGEWEIVVKNGFNNINNWAIWSAAIFKGYLYVGTMNYHQGCEIYRTKEGTEWEQVVGMISGIPSGFHQYNNNVFSWSMCVHNNELYVGTDGGELWKTPNGEKWFPLMAYKNIISARIKGSIMPRGFGGVIGRVGGIRNMIVFNDELYLSFLGGNIYFDIIFNNQQNYLTISDKLNIIQRVFHSAHGAELWKFNSNENKFSRVVGGQIWDVIFNSQNVSDKASRGGFGDPGNVYFWSMEIYNNRLYVGTFHPDNFNFHVDYSKGIGFNTWIDNPTGSLQLWVSSDGLTWEKCSGAPKNQYTVGIRSIETYNDQLILGVVNAETGCELWSFSQP